MAYGWSTGVPTAEFKRELRIEELYRGGERHNRTDESQGKPTGYVVVKRSDDVEVSPRFKGANKGYDRAKQWIDREYLKALKRDAATRKRTKEVFPTGEIPHLWAHRVQPSARNAQGNLYFRDSTIYSYGEHFPIAMHVQNASGKRAVLVTTRNYSVTTSGHVSAVRQAIPPNVQVFNVPNFCGHAALDHYVAEAKDAIGKAERSRGRGLWHLNQALALRAECWKYCKFYGVAVPEFLFIPSGRKLVKLTERLRADKKAATEKCLAKCLARDKARRAKREAERAAWEAAEPERAREKFLQEWQDAIDENDERRGMPERIAQWRAGADVNVRRAPETMLRIVNGEVETSLGARVPVEHAARGLQVVRACMASGREYQRNGHTVHLGHYAIDRIEADGTLHAGCHVIKWAEIARIADTLEGRVDDEPLLGELADGLADGQGADSHTHSV